MSDYDMSIHTNPSAAAWAEFFCNTTKDMPREVFADQGYMLGWFANAMMAMHDHLTGNAPVVMPDGSAVFVAEIGAGGEMLSTAKEPSHGNR